MQIQKLNQLTMCAFQHKAFYQLIHLFIGCSATSYKHHMKTCESYDWNKEKPCYAHHHHAGHKSQG